MADACPKLETFGLNEQFYLCKARYVQLACCVNPTITYTSCVLRSFES